MDIKNLKHHPSEDTEEFKKVIQKVTDEAKEVLTKRGVVIGQRGSVSQLNSTIRHLLKNDYNIEWCDPYTYNGVVID